MQTFRNSSLGVFLPALIMLPLQSTIEVDVNLINVFLTVHDADGRYVTGLGRDDFEVYEDGERRAIEVFETADGVQSSLGLLIDNSGSSADILDAVRSGVLDFAEGLPSGDEIFVMSFGTEDRVIHDFSDGPLALELALDQLESWGTSVFFDALDSGIRKVAATPNPRKALIVLTDGDDNGSERSYLEIVRAAESQMVMLYFIGMGPPILVDTHTLRGLAAMTGGHVVAMGRSDSPRDALDEIREDLSRQYYLGYYSSAGEGAHSIRVEVPGAEVTVRSREGFVVEPD
jgi:Ca-activated chloride channel family protein